jgi:hypothetical protein
VKSLQSAASQHPRVATGSPPENQISGNARKDDQAVLYLKDMTPARVEQQVALEIARDQMNLDMDRSIFANRKAGRFRT